MISGVVQGTCAENGPDVDLSMERNMLTHPNGHDMIRGVGLRQYAENNLNFDFETDTKGALADNAGLQV